MNELLFVLATLVAAIVATIVKGRTWAFAYLFVPFTLLVPWNLFFRLQGLPELSPHRAIAIGILIGCLLSGRVRDLLPGWRKLDLWMLLIILSYSTSFGLSTDLMGFFHKLTTQTLDWGLPYLYARLVFRDFAGLRVVIPPLAVCAAVLGFCSAYEARMSQRLLSEIWYTIAGYVIPDFWMEGGAYRWGLLRAFGPFGHPLVLATVLVAVVPLALSWGWLDRRYRNWSRLATLIAAVGVLGPISRGPMLALVAITGFFGMAAVRLPALLLTVFAATIGLAVFSGEVDEVVSQTQADLTFEGNTESGKYRLAILMIYVEEIPKLGPFGDVTVIGAKYEGAWSIDNGFLFMYITGGWLGGSLFLLLVLATCVQGYRTLIRSSGIERKIRACVTASFVGMTICIGNVWFTPEIGGFYFVLAALVWNQSSPDWYRSLPRGGSAAARRARGIPATPAPLASSSGRGSWSNPRSPAEEHRR